jgi:hypothetical protein
VIVVLAQGNLAWISWHPKSAASDHFKTNLTKVTPKVRMGSISGPQNKNIMFSSKIFQSFSTLHRNNSILMAGAISHIHSQLLLLIVLRFD